MTEMTKTTLAVTLTEVLIAAPEPKRLTIEAIYKDKIFDVERLNAPHWMQDGQRISYLDSAPGTSDTTLWFYDIRTNTRTPAIDIKALRLPKSDQTKPSEAGVSGENEDEGAPDPNAKADYLPIRGYQWSPDETRVLFARIPRNRASSGDNALYVYTLASRKLKRVIHADSEFRNSKWSPNGKWLGYVHKDDIFALEVATGKQVRLTDTAHTNVYNGRFGWVYEEELDLVDGFAFSPDSKRIAYFQIDENQVPRIDLPNYDELHMKPVETRYPKPGDPNPLVKIGLVPLPIGAVGELKVAAEVGEPKVVSGTAADKKNAAPNAVPHTLFADIGNDTDIYISRLEWSPQGDLLLHRMPRLQNKLEVLKVSPATGAHRVILTEEDKAWVDARGNTTFIKGTDQFVWHSDRDGYNHLYLYDLSGKMLRQLTKGKWDVDALVGVDTTHRLAYFTAANPSPMERQLFSVLLDGGGDIIRLTDAPGTHETLFAPDGQHYLDTHSNRGTAPHTQLYRASGQHVASVKANPMPKLDKHTLSEWEFTTFTTSDGVTLNAALLKPNDFDPKKKYPVLMYTYGGPGSQTVQDRYGNGGGLEQMLAQKGYIFAMVEGRGSGMRGRDFLKATYLNLGHYEVDDQISGAKWLGSLPYVDAKRIGIWGWSYGGYMACLCITRGADVFRTAVAVAPVTHWALYDSIYTERYMRRPADNPKGYAESSPITYADKLKGKFLIMHGIADDNVHFQNTARLVAAFQKNNLPFRMMAYPGKHHGIEGVSSHVFTTITDFFIENL